MWYRLLGYTRWKVTYLFLGNKSHTLRGMNGKVISKLNGNFFGCRIQAGQYQDAHELLNDLLKLEEESLGARTDKLADIYQLMSKTKSEV